MTGRPGNASERAKLVGHHRCELGGFNLHRATAEALAVREGNMRSDIHATSKRRLHKSRCMIRVAKTWNPRRRLQGRGHRRGAAPHRLVSIRQAPKPSPRSALRSMFAARLPKGIRQKALAREVGGRRCDTRSDRSIVSITHPSPDGVSRTSGSPKPTSARSSTSMDAPGTVAGRENRHQQRSDSDKGKNLAGDHGFVCPNQRLVAEWVGVQDVAD